MCVDKISIGKRQEACWRCVPETECLPPLCACEKKDTEWNIQERWRTIEGKKKTWIKNVWTPAGLQVHLQSKLKEAGAQRATYLSTDEWDLSPGLGRPSADRRCAWSGWSSPALRERHERSNPTVFQRHYGSRSSGQTWRESKVSGRKRYTQKKKKNTSSKPLTQASACAAVTFVWRQPSASGQDACACIPCSESLHCDTQYGGISSWSRSVSGLETDVKKGVWHTDLPQEEADLQSQGVQQIVRSAKDQIDFAAVPSLNKPESPCTGLTDHPVLPALLSVPSVPFTITPAKELDKLDHDEAANGLVSSDGDASTVQLLAMARQLKRQPSLAKPQLARAR